MSGIIKYKKKAIKVAGDPSGKKKIIGVVVPDRTVSFDDFITHIANHNSPYSRGVIKGVMTDAFDCLKELLLDGKNVRLADIGLFSVGITGKSAETLAAWTVQQNVTGVHLVVRNTKSWGNSELRKQVSLVEAGTYIPGESAKDE